MWQMNEWASNVTPPPPHGATVPSGPGSTHCRGFKFTLRHTTFGRTPVDGWSAWSRDLYPKTHNTHKRQTSVPAAGFEPTIPASEPPQTHVLDGAANGIGLRMVVTGENQNTLKTPLSVPLGFTYTKIPRGLAWHCSWTFTVKGWLLATQRSWLWERHYLCTSVSAYVRPIQRQITKTPTRDSTQLLEFVRHYCK
jgi:hypothetical protein